MTKHNQSRPRLPKELADAIANQLPGVPLTAAVQILRDHYSRGVVDPISCAQNELWIKADRLQGILELLHLSNLETADTFRRLEAGTLKLLGQSAGSMADRVPAKKP